MSIAPPTEPPSPVDPASPRRHPVATVAAWQSMAAEREPLLPALQALRRRAAAPEWAAAWIHLCPDAAWAAQMDRLAQRLAETAATDGASAPEAGARAGSPHDRYPLLGVPFALKDNIDIAGEPTTAACPAFTYTAARSAHVVQQLLDAGAIWLGKTNLDQFATGLVGSRSPYGRPACVDDRTRISGGSSSGSAVVVAAGLVPFALGTDTAGSGRVPAGFNGLVGLKPTPGRVSTSGVLPACRTLDCVSIFAHTVDDAAQVLAVIEGPDDSDAFSDFRPGPAAAPPRGGGGPPRPDVDAEPGYDRAWAATLQRLRDEGHELVEIDFGLLDEVAALLYDGPWVAERHAVVQTLMATAPEKMDPVVRQVIARAMGMTATATFEAQYKLRALARRAARLWQQVDQLLVPTAPTHPRFSELDADPVGVNARLGRYTNFVNLLGWCALALPAGRTATGLPFGVTVIGPGGHDAALAQQWRHWAPGPERPLSAPAAMPATSPELPLAVVGAHLSGLPLNGQLRDRGARLLEATVTAPAYRLYALPGTTPPKPGLQRVPDGEAGHAIALEVWSLPMAAVGSLLALIPSPLGLGSVELADGRRVHGFLCESHALAGAQDISAFGGWRAYLASLN
jgi:allophanate hydrolase